MSENDQVSDELRQIKILLIASLIKDGVKQGDVAALLGISDAKLSRMLPSGSRSFRPKGAG